LLNLGIINKRSSINNNGIWQKVIAK